MSWLDRAIEWMAPQWGANRARARMMVRHFEAASFGRRTEGWHRLGTDANAAAAGAALSTLRAQARDLVRNNPWARHGLHRIVTNTVGWGIKPKATGRGAGLAQQRWRDWAETTQCDAAGRLTMYGLQALAMSTIAEAGEVLIRRRWRLPTDGLAVPLQLQILEPDFLDHTRDGPIGEAGGPIIQGVEHDGIGRRVAYWLFDRHPGSTGFALGNSISAVSRRIPAADILHVYHLDRPGQVRGTSWFASVDVRLHELDGFEDATVVKQRISASLAAFVTDMGDGGGPLAVGGTDATTGQPTDTIEPGMILSLQPGKQVTVANPPTATDYQPFTTCSLRAIAAGLDITYEDLTGDFSQTTYSSGRLGRLGAQASIHDWRWNMLVPQLCAPIWSWMLDAMILAGAEVERAPAKWAPPPAQLLDPDREGKANQQLVRSGQMTWPQMVREQGEDPDEQLDEIEAFNAELDRRGIVLDCDPRRVTSAGQIQQAAQSVAAPIAKEPSAADARDQPAGDGADASGDAPDA